MFKKILNFLGHALAAGGAAYLAEQSGDHKVAIACGAAGALKYVASVIPHAPKEN